MEKKSGHAAGKEAGEDRRKGGHPPKKEAGEAEVLLGGQEVILLHGLAHKGPIWRPRLRRELEEAGFVAVPLDYPSRRGTIDDHVGHVYRQLQQRGLLQKRLFFVGHSLGGIVALRLLERYPTIEAAGLVLVASPVRGSRLATFLASSRLQRLFRWIYGPILDELTLASGQPGDPLFVSPPCPVAFFQGTRPFHPLALTSYLGRRVLPPTFDHDGTVCADETLLTNEETPIFCLPYTHTLLLFSTRFRRELRDLLSSWQRAEKELLSQAG